VLALKSNGTVLAWGSNGSSQLGDGTTTDPSGPVQVTGLANATQVTAGDRFSLAVHTVLGLVGS
jgi:alpha-tubulin suppressor-like RCC1 family protein